MSQQTDKKVFFHVGLPKTASTFLQLNVFPFFNGVEFVKKHDFKRKDRIIENSSSERILLSTELDLDRPGGIGKVEDVSGKYPNTYPIVVLRKHGSWLRSKYKYYLRKHGDKTFEEYFNPQNDKGLLTRKNLEYYPKIKLLEEYFEKRPLVLFQEELKHAPYKFIDIIAEYVGADYSKPDIKIKTVKKAYSDKQLKRVRRFNKFYKFDKSKAKSKAGRFVYKKLSAFFLHSVAYVGSLLPGSALKNEYLVPEESIRKVNEALKDDWKKCIEYAKEDRSLYLPKA